VSLSLDSVSLSVGSGIQDERIEDLLFDAVFQNLMHCYSRECQKTFCHGARQIEGRESQDLSHCTESHFFVDCT